MPDEIIYTENSFVEEICEQHDRGFGFVPLVGAGLSAASGVPLIHELQKYLHKCIALALGLDRVTQPHNLPQFHKTWRWHPQRDEWPPIHTSQAYHCDDVDWQKRIGEAVAELNARAKLQPDNVWKDYPELQIFLEAYGATAEWRSSLSFLARLREKETSDGRVLSLGAIDAHVCDNFFLSVVQGKTPTLGHKMLARLANPLGVNTIMTLNFEDLIEHAFLDVQNPLTVYAVHQDAGLPAFHSRFGKNVLIKMHGDRYGLRTDYSLDEIPSEEDCRHFTSYLANRVISPQDWEKLMKGKIDPLPVRNHLLVVGLAVQEERVLAMIRRARDALDPKDFKVYWIVFRKEEINAASTRLKEMLHPEARDGQSDSKEDQSKADAAKDGPAKDASPTKGSSKEEPSEELCYRILQHHSVGLLFYNLYQNLTGALPPDGAIFPAQARTPVPPSSLKTVNLKAEEEARIEDLQQQIDEPIERCFHPVNRGTNPRRLVVASSEAEKFYGIVSAAAASFYGQLDKGRQAVWLDLDEVTCADELFEVLLHTMAIKAGVVDWMPVLAQSGTNDMGMSKQDLTQARQQELARLTHNPDRQWVVYLNARSGGAGANFVSVDSYRDKYDESGPNGWLDRSEVSQHADNARPASDSAAEFVSLIDGFCREECPNIALVLLCYERPKSEYPQAESTSDQAAAADSAAQAEASGQAQTDSRPKNTHTVLKELAGQYESVMIPETSCLETAKSSDSVVDKAVNWVNVGEGTPAENNDDDDNDDTRRRFLFACASVNRVRSPTLLWSWAFHGGNVYDKDSKLKDRRKRTSRWIQKLQNLHVVRLQSGGFVWMQSDIRRSLRKKLREYYEDSERKNFQSIIPRVHQGIAEWYARLHVSSRSPRAATEVAYHQCIRARFLLKQLPEKYDDTKTPESVHQVLQALGAAIRILRQGRPSMLSDGFTQGACRRLEDIRDKQCREKIVEQVLSSEGKGEGKRDLLDSPDSTSKPNAKKVDSAIEQLTLLTYSLNVEIAQEIGNHVQAYARAKTISERSCPFDRRPLRDLLRLWNKYASLGIAVRSSDATDRELSKVFDRVNYRLLEDAPKLFRDRNRDELSDDIRNRTRQWLDSQARKEARGRSRAKRNDSESALIENMKLQLATGVVKTLQRNMQGALCEAVYAQVWCRRMSESPDALESQQAVTNRLDKAREKAGHCYELAIELNRAVQRDGLRYQESQASGIQARRMVTRDDIAGWFDDQQRLDTQHALCLALKGDYTKAFRRLNEAEAALVEVRGAHGMEQAIIDLHRAVIFQWQASIRGGKFRHKVLEAYRSLTDPKDESVSVSPDFHHEVSQAFEDITRQDRAPAARAFIEDSWQALDRAKPILERFRKNAWWTTWYFELQMKLIEYELFASLSEPYAPLPYLGTQAVPCSISTQLDGLLDSSRRMIRMDVYRLARVVESYSNSLLGLGLWRWQVLSKYAARTDESNDQSDRKITDRSEQNSSSRSDDKTSDNERKWPERSQAMQARELHEREVSMLDWLASSEPRTGRETRVIGALHSLTNLFDSRRTLGKTKKSPLSSDVKSYVEYVIEHAQTVADFSRQNIKATRAIAEADLFSEPAKK